MNDKLALLSRQLIKEGLKQLPEKCHALFKRMYGNSNLNIDDVVDSMPVSKLSRAMDQVNATLEKFNSKS